MVLALVSVTHNGDCILASEYECSASNDFDLRMVAEEEEEPDDFVLRVGGRFSPTRFCRLKVKFRGLKVDIGYSVWVCKYLFFSLCGLSADLDLVVKLKGGDFVVVVIAKGVEGTNSS